MEPNFIIKRLGAGHRSVGHSEKTLEYLKLFESIFGKEAKRVGILHLLIDNRVYDRELIEKLVSKYRLTKNGVVRKTWLKCKNCGWEWNYKGKKDYATCPNCRRAVNIKTEKISWE